MHRSIAENERQPFRVPFNKATYLGKMAIFVRRDWTRLMAINKSHAIPDPCAAAV